MLTIHVAEDIGAGVVKHWEVEGRLGGGAGADLKLIASIEKKELRDVRAPHAPNRSALTAH